MKVVSIMEWINIIAIITGPIIAIFISQKLQERNKKREDKVQIFKILMTSRIYGWSNESVYALNIIDIVFSDEQEVIDKWHMYHDKLRIENPSETDLQKIREARNRLLETIAISLGYKDKITWSIIETPYIPTGMYEQMQQQKTFQQNQCEAIDMMKSFIMNANNKEKI